MRLFVALTIPLMLSAAPAFGQSCRASAQAPDAEAGEAFVRSFFAAFDARDSAAIESLVAPGAIVVHDNGVATDIPELLRVLRTTREWVPRDRRIRDCSTSTHGPVLITGCINEVTFHRAGADPAHYVYNETWILDRTSGGLRAIRAHYSRVTQTEHSEELP